MANTIDKRVSHYSARLPLYEGGERGELGGDGSQWIQRRASIPAMSALSQLSRRRKLVLGAIVAVVGLLGWNAISHGPSSKSDVLEDPNRPPLPPLPYHGHDSSSQLEDDALFARQSKSLKQAKARYHLKNNRPTPPGYDKFYAYAQENGCMIDEYDKVHRNFEPFYQIAEYHPTFFSEMLKTAMPLAQNDHALCLTPFTIRNHTSKAGHKNTPFTGDWEKIVEKIAPMLPEDIDIVFNYQDEPRVLFNIRRPDAQEFALKKLDNTPFKQARGFSNLTNDVNAFILSSTSTQHTHDLYPVLSPARLSSCFADIVIPSSYYYDRSAFAARYNRKDDVSWADKKNIIYWRGSTSGGALDGQNYHSFPRFRIVDMSLKRPDLIDAAITRLHNCNPRPNNAQNALCLEEEIKKEYNVNSPQPREEVYKYKYLLDLDGNSFSGRYFGLLRSGSLVFKSTTFSEFFDDWLIPYKHFIPVLPDLSDLEKKVQWAIDNDEEARQIQANGLEYATRVPTDLQMDCYHMNAFLEYARLQNP